MSERKRKPGRPRKDPARLSTGNPLVQERMAPELAEWVKRRQKEEPGYLARLAAADLAKHT